MSNIYLTNARLGSTYPQPRREARCVMRPCYRRELLPRALAQQLRCQGAWATSTSEGGARIRSRA